MEQKDWTIAMEGLAQYYTDKCEALQAEVIDLRERLARATPKDGGLLQQATAAMFRVERDEVAKRGEKIMALELENAAKDKRIAKLRNTIDVLEINMRELAKRVLPSTETHFLHMKAERDSWKEKCDRMHSEIQKFNNYRNQRQSEIDALRQRLADSENTVAQLRAARDKRKPEYVHVTVNGDTRTHYDHRTKEMRADGSVLLRDPVTGNTWTTDGVEVERTPVAPQEAVSEVMAAMHEDENDSFKAAINEIVAYQKAKIDAFFAGGYAADKDGWIEWRGGECPVDRGTMVIVLYRDGKISDALPAMESVKGALREASRAFWVNDGCQSDIVAYRLAKKSGSGMDDMIRC